MAFCSINPRTWIFMGQTMSVLVFQHMGFTPIITLNNWKRCHHHNWWILSGVYMETIVLSYPSVRFREAHGRSLTYLGEERTRWPAIAAFQIFQYSWLLLFSVCVILLRIIRCYNSEPFLNEEFESEKWNYWSHTKEEAASLAWRKDLSCLFSVG